jgi:hypothetical protein
MLRNKIFVIFLISLMISLETSCATIVSTRYQSVTFESEPEGAKVIVGGRTIGRTPLTIPVERASKQTLSFEKEGYDAVTMPFTTITNVWFLGNAGVTFIFGSTIDHITGAVNEYSPSAYHITLKPKGSAFFTPEGEIKVFILSNYLNIVKEANTSSREYLPALFSLLKIPKKDQKLVMQNLKYLINESENSLVFTEKIINNYVKNSNVSVQ